MFLRVCGGCGSVPLWRLSGLTPTLLFPWHLSLPYPGGNACMCVSATQQCLMNQSALEYMWKRGKMGLWTIDCNSENENKWKNLVFFLRTLRFGQNKKWLNVVPFQNELERLQNWIHAPSDIAVSVHLGSMLHGFSGLFPRSQNYEFATTWLVN